MQATIVSDGYVNHRMIFVDVVVLGQRYSVATNDLGDTWSTLHSHGPMNSAREQLAFQTARTWSASHPDEMLALGRELEAQKMLGAVVEIVRPYVEENKWLVVDFRMRSRPGAPGPKFMGRTLDWITWDVTPDQPEDQGRVTPAKELIERWAATHQPEHEALAQERDDSAGEQA